MSTMRRISILALVGLALLVIGGCQKKSETPDPGSGSAKAGGGTPKGSTPEGGKKPDAGKTPDGGRKADVPAPAPDPGDPQETPAPVPPCFPDKGPIAFKVEGVPVPKATVDRYLALWSLRSPRMSEKTRLRRAIEEGVIPVAAMYAKYKDELPYLMGRATRIHKRLVAGDDWSTVVVEESHDPNRQANLGSQGIRRQLATPGLAPPEDTIEDVAFRLKIDTFSKPVITKIGIQIIKVDTEVKKKEPGETTRNISRILVSYDKAYRKALRSFPMNGTEEQQEAAAGHIRVFIERFKRIIQAARVELVDQSYRASMYPFRLKKS